MESVKINLEVSDDSRQFLYNRETYIPLMIYLEDHASMNGNVVHHYTSTESLYNIAKHNWKTLHVSNIAHLNDKYELEYGIRMANDLIEWLDSHDTDKKEFLQLTKNQIDGEGSKFGEYLDESYEVFKYIFHWMADNLELVKSRVFCFSLSTAYNKLSQWRAYSKNGAGVCITFNKEELKAEKWLYLPVIYKPKAQKIVLKRWLSFILGTVAIGAYVHYIQYKDDKRKKPKPLLSDRTGMLESIITSSAIVLVQGLMTLKHPSFSEEREVRLVTFELDEDQGRTMYKYTDRMRAYIEYSIGNKQLPIKEITAGPLMPDDEWQILIGMLKRKEYYVNGKAVKARMSNIPSK